MRIFWSWNPKGAPDPMRFFWLTFGSCVFHFYIDFHVIEWDSLKKSVTRTLVFFLTVHRLDSQECCYFAISSRHEQGILQLSDLLWNNFTAYGGRLRSQTQSAEKDFREAERWKCIFIWFLSIAQSLMFRPNMYETEPTKLFSFITRRVTRDDFYYPLNSMQITQLGFLKEMNFFANGEKRTALGHKTIALHPISKTKPEPPIPPFPSANEETSWSNEGWPLDNSTKLVSLAWSY